MKQNGDEQRQKWYTYCKVLRIKDEVIEETSFNGWQHDEGMYASLVSNANGVSILLDGFLVDVL